MSVFRKIFGSNSDKSKEKLEKEDQHKFLPDEDAPVDETFTINFNNNGGKFLYCETIDEVQNNLKNIVEENKTYFIFFILDSAPIILVKYQYTYQVSVY